MDNTKDKLLQRRSKLSPTQRSLLEKRLRGEVDSQLEVIPRRSQISPAPLSFAQQRPWFLHQLDPDNPYYSEIACVQLLGALNVDALERSLNEIVQRHEALRTTFEIVEEQAVQVIHSAVTLKLPVVNLDLMPEVEQQAQVEQLTTEIAQKPFDLTTVPLLRSVLLQIDVEEYLLVFAIHHIVVDGWSIGVFIRELALLYEAFYTNKTYPLPELPIQYADFAIWQRQWLQGELQKTQLDYWKQQLAGAATLALPTDRPRPPVQSFRGAVASFELSASLTDMLRNLSNTQGVTLFMTLLAAFQALLYRYTGQEDICVGSPIANRNQGEIQGLIGFFVNTLVLRTDLAGNPSFLELLNRVRQVCVGAYANSDIPFEQLVEELQPDRNISHMPLFQVMFALQEDTQKELTLPNLTLNWLPTHTQTARFDLTLHIVDAEPELRGLLECNTDLFDAETITRIVEHLRTLLEGIVANPQARLSDLPLLTANELNQRLLEWNNTQIEYPQQQCIHELFEAQVERTPDAVAVVFEDEQLTYSELNARANQLRHYLHSLGVKPEVLVGICVERSLCMIIGLLAILKAGGAYVPLDPSYPQDRLAYMLSDSRPSVLLTQQHLVENLPTNQAQVICIDSAGQLIANENAENTECHITVDCLAYVIYTSGSTGKPKGAMNTHQGICNRLVWMQDTYQLTAADSVLQKTPFSFDVSVWEFFWTLMTGARLVVAQPEAHKDPNYLVNLIRKQRITTLHFVPSMLQVFLQVEGLEKCQSLMRVIASGEALPVQLQQSFFHRLDAQLHNLYGPTEAAIDVTCWQCQDSLSNQTTVPIGRPIANIQIYLLDKYLNPVARGVAGEVYISGVGVGRGYFHRPDLTAEKFIPNPFSDKAARLYKTGDLARYLPTGEIEYIGRVDHQVKIRGFRIELGEIEALISQHSAVRETVVVVHSDSVDSQRIVAYIVPEKQQTLKIAELRSFLESKLPSYMMPAAFVTLEALPLTPNGKFDRKALPVPELIQLSSNYITPTTPIENLLAGIWAEVLRIDKVGINNNFFELGGHSLIATRVISQIRQVFQIELPLRCLFEKPTIAGLAKEIETANNAGLGIETTKIEPIERTPQLPLSFAQQRLWFLAQLEPDSPFYNIPAAVRLQGELNYKALQQSFDEILRRHQALRTNFQTVEGQAVAIIKETKPLLVPLADLSQLSSQQQQVEVEQQAFTEAQQPFELTNDPLLRVKLLRLDVQEHIVLLTMHHIASDAWSIDVLVRELATLYQAFCNQQPSPLSELPIQYVDFAAWQRQWLQAQVLSTQLSYWLKHLEDAPKVLELPTDYPRPAIQTFQGATYSFELSKELSASLNKFSQQQGSTLFMTLLAAFQTLLWRYTGQQDIIVGSPIANRNRGEIEGLIGFFVNTLVLRTNLAGNPSFEELLKRVREVALGAYAHQDLPFELLVEQLQVERSLSHTPLFQVMFVLQNAPMSALELPGLTLTSIESESGTALFDLTLEMTETESGLVGSLEYNTDLFAQTSIQRMAGHLQKLLEAIVANPQQRLSQLQLLSESEQHQLLEEWSNTKVEYPQDQCIHQLFEAQVEHTPDAIAVVFENQQLTYTELNAKANQLAHYLRSLVVKPEVLVGICFERSLEMAIAILAVLKAGGAYIPIDPTIPQARIDFLLEDARVSVLLSSQKLHPLLSQSCAQVICLDVEWSKISTQQTTNPINLANSENLAYVIYTSGSTGKPKGVAVNHTALVNYSLEIAQQFELQRCDRFLQFASIGFDVVVEELFPTWLTGATVVLRHGEQLISCREFQQLIEQQQLTVFELPTAYWHQWVSELASNQETVPGCVRLAIVGGERILPERLKEWQNFSTPLVHVYGLTETTVTSTLYNLSNETKALDTGKELPIGRPIANTQIYLLDSYFQPVPVGVIGEIYIGGEGIARGYLNRPELTAQRFIPNLFSQKPGLRLYKTGDLARYSENGNIEYIGRRDYQVKLRGFRIELSEIEAVLAQYQTVAEGVVLLKEDTPGNPYLTAYIVPKKQNLNSLNEQDAQQKEGIELWPSHGEYPVYDQLLYDAMTNDERRNNCYKVAINQLVKNKIVVEVGTGQDAILARFCLEAGAKKVYAIEKSEEAYQLAKTCIEKLGFSDKITVILGDATQSNLPELADICVSKIVGTIGGSEGMAVILNNARRFLKENGVMIPQRSITKIAAACLPDEFLENLGFNRGAAHYIDKIFEAVGYPFDVRLCLKNFPKSNLISNIEIFEDLDFTKSVVETEYIQPINFTIEKKSRLDGFLLWLNLSPIEGETLDVLQEDYSFLPLYFPVFSPGIEVEAEDKIQAFVNCKLSDNGVNPDYEIEGRLIRINGEVVEFYYESPHHKKLFKQTTFYEKIFAQETVVIKQNNRLNNSNRYLINYLQEYLPDYMIPSAFMELEAFPLTPNGKIDRKALQSYSPFVPETEYIAPTTSVEEILAGIWQEILGIEKVGVRDNFFELGGDSILSLQIVAKAHQAGFHITPKQIFQHQTIAELVSVVDTTIQNLAEQGIVTGSSPLTPIQTWFFEQNFSFPHHWNQSTLLETKSEIDRFLLEKAIQRLLEHHDILRLCFDKTSSGFQPVILEEQTVSVAKIDLSEISPEQLETEIIKAANYLQTSLNILTEPLIKVGLIDLGTERSGRLFIVIHHLVIDDVSWRILLEDIQNIYQQLEQKKTVKLPLKTTSFKQWANRIQTYAQSQELLTELDYWLEMLHQPVKPLPKDYSSEDNLIADTNTITVALGIEDTQALLKEVPTVYRTEINDVLLTALVETFAQWTGERSLLFDLEGHGREELFEDIDLSRTVGWFTNIYPVLLNLEQAVEPSTALKATKEQLRSIPQHGVGYGLLRYLNQEQKVTKLLNSLPQSEICFNYFGQYDQVLAQSLLFKPALESSGNNENLLNHRFYLFEINSAVKSGSLKIWFSYNKKLHKKSTVKTLAQGFIEALKSLIRSSQSTRVEFSISDFPLVNLTQEELESAFNQVLY